MKFTKGGKFDPVSKLMIDEKDKGDIYNPSNAKTTAPEDKTKEQEKKKIDS